MKSRPRPNHSRTRGCPGAFTTWRPCRRASGKGANGRIGGAMRGDRARCRRCRHRLPAWRRSAPTSPQGSSESLSPLRAAIEEAIPVASTSIVIRPVRRIIPLGGVERSHAHVHKRSTSAPQVGTLAAAITSSSCVRRRRSGLADAALGDRAHRQGAAEIHIERARSWRTTRSCRSRSGRVLPAPKT